MSSSERQLIHRGPCKVLRFVRGGQRTIQAGIVADAERAQIVDGLGVGVVEHHIQAMRCALFERDLKCVEVGVPTKLVPSVMLLYCGNAR